MNFTSASAFVEKTIDYSESGNSFQGFAVYPETSDSKTPAILILHNWMGITEETKSKARAFAELGYIAFAADIYGKGIRPKSVQEAASLAQKYKGDRATFRAHLNAALKTLQKQKGVDVKRISVAGYCFGGTGALELARSGADVKGILSFHGGLDSPDPALGKNIKGRVIAFHGADDPYVSATDLAAFENEMRTHHVDWQLIKFGNAVHSFTDKGAGNDPSKGAAYQEAADQRSWEMTRAFLKSITNP